MILSFIWLLKSSCYLSDSLAKSWIVWTSADPCQFNPAEMVFLFPVYLANSFFWLPLSLPLTMSQCCIIFCLFLHTFRYTRVIKQEEEARWGWRTSLKSHLKFSAEAEVGRRPSGTQTDVSFIACTFIASSSSESFWENTSKSAWRSSS